MKEIFASKLCPIFLAGLGLIASGAAFAGSATWKLSPTSGDWITAGNWSPATVPNGPSDIASFGSSNVTDLAVIEDVEVNSIVFNPGAAAFTTTIQGKNGTSGQRTLTISGAGIVNNSGVTQNFINLSEISFFDGAVIFTNNATAGGGCVFSNYGAKYGNTLGGETNFHDASTLGTSTIINNGTEIEGFPGYTRFYDSSSAENGTIINNSAGFAGGETDFYQDSTAGSASITVNGARVIDDGYVSTRFTERSTAGSSTITVEGSLSPSSQAFLSFYGDSSADDAVIIAESDPGDRRGGAIIFGENSHGGTAQFKLYRKGNIDISNHNPHGVTIGSLEGDGNVFLGKKSLLIGANNLSTEFDGVISQMGSIVKLGRGTLSLNSGNQYRGGTTVKQGKLLINNATGSGTGSGPVTVEGGTLGGIGRIAGTVTIGDEVSDLGSLSPGAGALGTLTIQRSLTWNSDGSYDWNVNSNRLSADKVTANGVTINGAVFRGTDMAAAVLPVGYVFTLIDNTSTTPISGTFSNLSDGSTITIGSNTFQANYDGGDGNDLTLTVTQ